MIERIKYINYLLKSEMSPGEYTIINSAWLTIMDIRINGDLDLIVSQNAWGKYFNNNDINRSFGLPGKYERRIRVHAQNGPYTNLSKKYSNDDLIYRYSVNIEGLNFIEPKLYFEYKINRFNNIKKKYNDLVWYKKNWLYLIFNNKKLLKKYNKDKKDLAVLKQYFLDKKHLNKNFSFLDESVWGVSEPILREFIRN